MFEVAMWVACIAGLGILVVTISANRDAAKFFVEQARRDTARWKWREAWQRHGDRMNIELASLREAPWPSGRTITDADGVVHSVPAGCFAITMCERAINPSCPLAADVVDRYPYDPPGSSVATCMECLGREQAC